MRKTRNMRKCGVGVVIGLLGMSWMCDAALVSKWTFNTSGDLGADSVGTNDFEALSGFNAPVYHAGGLVGGAACFDDDSGWETTADIYPNGSFTFSAWVKPDDVTVSSLVTPYSRRAGFEIYAAGGSWRARVWKHDLTSDVKVGPSVIADTWTHIAIVYNAVSGPDANGNYTGTFRLWVNGENLGGVDGAEYNANDTYTMRLGSVTSTAQYRGLIDEVSLYDAALSAAEIEALAVKPKPEAVLSVNLIDNPGFEYKSLPDGAYGSLPLYWSKTYYSAGGTFGVTNEVKHGEQSLFVADASDSAAAGLSSDPIPVTPGYSYTLRGWGWRDSTSYASVYIRFYDSGDTLLRQESVAVGAAGQWTAGDVSATAPEDAEYVRVLLYSGSSSVGVCFFDSVSLVLAEERIGDGGFTNASTGVEPENWQSYGSGSFSVIDDGGNNILRVTDNSSSLSAGASYYSSAVPGTPYRLQANVRKASGSGYAKLYLSFYDADDTQLAIYSTGSSSGSFVQRSIGAVAPAGTVYARALCYSSTTDTGTADFDDVSFTRNYGTTQYAAPEAAGTGTGDSAANAAAYTSSNLWSAVNAAAATEPVRVVLLEGDYDSQWLVDGLGNADNNILIEGETPYAVNYCGTDGNYFIYISDSRNVTFRHIHFSAYEDPNDLNLPYLEQLSTYDYYGVLRLDGADPDSPTCDVRFEGLSFTHMLLPAWSATDPHYEYCHDIFWERCSWVTIGYDLYDHSVYCSDGAYNLDFESCFFQDCAGVYLRYRSGSKGRVENCRFISTGNMPTGDHWSRVHWSFIQLFAGVSASHPDEKLADHYAFKNNSFTYEQTGLRGFLSPYQLYVSGPAPSSEPTFHLVPLADGAVIGDTTALTSTRNALFETYFGIDPSVAFDISGNTYSGCWSNLFMMNVYPDPVDVYWTVPPSETASENVDIDKLVGLD